MFFLLFPCCMGEANTSLCRYFVFEYSLIVVFVGNTLLGPNAVRCCSSDDCRGRNCLRERRYNGIPQRAFRFPKTDIENK